MTDRVASTGWVERATALAMDEWRRAADPWAGSGPRYSPREQKVREKAYDRALDEVRRTCRRRTPDAETRLTNCFGRFAAEALDLGPASIDLLNHGFLPIGMQLARWAHRFDPSLSQADITQAARNAWTACGMQPMFGAPLRLTPAILAYSLLYPYSDNYLDRENVTHRDKVRFSECFRARLRGALPPGEPLKTEIVSMIRMIEDEFPRSSHPEVFDALLAIHAAQEESLKQLEHCGAMHEGELLRISCAKGGTSVLADACLVRGSLDAAQSEFAFLWGVMLQLGDDLQDAGEDLERGSDTLFTRAIRDGRPLDSLVEQLLNFAGMAAARMNALPGGSPTHKGLLRMSWRSLILFAVADAHAYFTPAFLGHIEPWSPFRFAFLRKRRQKLQGDRGLFERLFELVMNSKGDQAIPLPIPENGTGSLGKVLQNVTKLQRARL
ncbi:hypothetical protein [Occallatibacter riparius]|uniref:Uncharacterized protein n=1 Tax=Occallatibacter riparius TaxID=1002689 RepID=A0A9J7BSY3_9BACT|nr:hypothetical protein [Occallatibacter riparius]UWZ85760.1 hypothetical protein MOP44_07395 [Occallatibacter riparius]